MGGLIVISMGFLGSLGDMEPSSLEDPLEFLVKNLEMALGFFWILFLLLLFSGMSSSSVKEYKDYGEKYFLPLVTFSSLRGFGRESTRNKTLPYFRTYQTSCSPYFPS